jgi:hypothetical protein
MNETKDQVVIIIAVIIGIFLSLLLFATYDISESQLTEHTKQECLKKATNAVELCICVANPSVKEQCFKGK